MEAFWSATTTLIGRLDAEYYMPEFVAAHERLISRVNTRPFNEFWEDSNRIYIGIAGFDTLPSNGRYTRYLRPADIGDDGSIDYEHLPWCEQHWLTEHGQKGCAQPGDLIVEVKGNTRRVAVIDDRVPPNVVVSGSSYRLRLKPSLDTHFAQAYLLSALGQSLKKRLTSNTTISYIDPESFRNYLVPVPPLDIQKAIGNKMRKATLLRRTAERSQRRAMDRINEIFGPADWADGHSFGWITPGQFETRIDAWFNQPAYLRMADHLAKREGLLALSEIVTLSTETVDLRSYSDSHFDYYEIADVDADSGAITPSRVSVHEAPSRAKYAVRAGDILLSTVRPNRKGIAIVPDDVSAAVCSSGFAVLRAPTPEQAYFLRACLTHDAATEQLMRWNTGATYPAIERSVPLSILVPRLAEEHMHQLGSDLYSCAKQLATAQELIRSASKDVEDIINGEADEAWLVEEGQQIESWLKQYRF